MTRVLIAILVCTQTVGPRFHSILYDRYWSCAAFEKIAHELRKQCRPKNDGLGREYRSFIELNDHQHSIRRRLQRWNNVFVRFCTRVCPDTMATFQFERFRLERTFSLNTRRNIATTLLRLFQCTIV